tara:strand:+ start:3608 stop:4564 length:957 start_codon:yes stop_codon:yes gene_type:complete
MASKNFYKLLLQNDVKKSHEALRKDYDAQSGKLNKQANRGSIGGTIGGLLGQFGVPMLMGVLAPATGGASLLFASAAAAAAGSYLGNKAGQEMGDKGSIEGIKNQKFGNKTRQSYKSDISGALGDIEESAQIGALKAGAAVGASGITMGVDKYAMYAQNPLGSYVSSMRNPAQLAAAKETALKGLTPGSELYKQALAKHTSTATSNIVKGSNKTSILDLVRQTGGPQSVSAPIKAAPLVNTALNKSLDELIAFNTYANQNAATFKGNNTAISAGGLLQSAAPSSTNQVLSQGLNTQMVDPWSWDRYFNNLQSKSSGGI